MKKLIVSLIIFSSVLMGSFMVPAIARADVAPECNGSSSFLGFPTWYKYLDVGDKDGQKCAIKGPVDPSNAEKLNWEAAVPRIALAVVEILLRVAGLVAVGFVVYGGFKYITSQGEPDATKTARQTIINALIGVVIAMIATAIVSFVARTLSN